MKLHNLGNVLFIMGRRVIWFLCSDTIIPTDVGLEEEAQDDDRGYGVSGVSRFNRVGRWAQPITFLDIHECDSFTVKSLHLILNSSW